jgi:hypothetical protein
MTRRASLPGVDELFRSQKERSEEPDEPQVTEAVSLQVAKESGPGPGPGQNRVQEVRTLQEPDPQPQPQAQPPAVPVAVPAPAALPSSEEIVPAESDAGRRPRHEEKVTFYCTASDLTRIERARLALRAEHRLASDRGRIVRAALAEILDDFESNGSSSALVRRLRHDRASS